MIFEELPIELIVEIIEYLDYDVSKNLSTALGYIENSYPYLDKLINYKKYDGVLNGIQFIALYDVDDGELDNVRKVCNDFNKLRRMFPGKDIDVIRNKLKLNSEFMYLCEELYYVRIDGHIKKLDIPDFRDLLDSINISNIFRFYNNICDAPEYIKDYKIEVKLKGLKESVEIVTELQRGEINDDEINDILREAGISLKDKIEHIEIQLNR